MKNGMVIIAAGFVTFLLSIMLTQVNEMPLNIYPESAIETDSVLIFKESGYFIRAEGLMHVKYPDFTSGTLQPGFEKTVALFTSGNEIPCYAIQFDSIRETQLTVKPIIFNPDADPTNAELTAFYLTAKDDDDLYFIIPTTEMKNKPKVLPYDVTEDTTNPDNLIYYVHGENGRQPDTLLIRRSAKVHAIYYNSQHLLTYNERAFNYGAGIHTVPDYGWLSDMTLRIDVLLDFDKDGITDWIGSFGNFAGGYTVFYSSASPGKIAISFDRSCDRRCMHESSY
ncbi:MAG: hypothetical protein IT279_08135 [Ignavibacteriaceae bacterium]|nr:hypothetical protein [Ignavibacteriaceae bacterium]